MSIGENLKQLHQQIAEACQLADRATGDVRLLAASKRTDAQGVRTAIQAGQLLFGENQAQALRDKFDAVQPSYLQSEWHFIGHLQKNKVKYVVGRASMIHSIDSLALAAAVNKRILQQREMGHPLPAIKVLVQVKLGHEESKSGIAPTEALDLCHQIQQLPGLQLAGLMTIPPLYGTPKEWFSQLAELASKGREQQLPLTELSMGMSADLTDAIACGATIIRVGSAIFCR